MQQKYWESMVQIVNPELKRGKPPRDMRLSDYITVPRLSLRGHYRVEDIVRFTKQQPRKAA